MNTTMTERLVAIAQAAHKAGHGSKEAIYRAACEELCMSRSTLMKKLVSGKKPRKKRSDAGNRALTREEATLISGVLMEATRNTGESGSGKTTLRRDLIGRINPRYCY